MANPLVTKPVFEHHPDGLGIGDPRPRISWRFVADASTVRSWTQTAYEVEVALPHRSTTRSYHVESGNNILVPWPAESLESRQRACIRVRCYGQTGDASPARISGLPTEWSPFAVVEAGLLRQDDFIASFITASQHVGPEYPLRPLRFQKKFSLPLSVKPTRARLYITSLGVFEACINQSRVGDECMAPGWTSYTHRLNYRVYDIGPQLLDTDNVIAVEVGEGWYAGRLGFRGGTRFLYGGRELALLCQLEVDYIEHNESQRFTLASDDSWECGPSVIVSSEIYDGETHDMLIASQSTEVDAADLTPTKTIQWPRGMELVAPRGPPVRVVDSRPPSAILKSKSGKTILDFGQNLVGKLMVKFLHLPIGCKITFRHAEVLEHQELGTRPLNEAKCEDTVVSSGEPLRDWTPKFTFHGFRYVEVEGWPDEDESILHNVSALIIQSDIRRRGTFSCSNTSVNQLHENIVWSMRGNFVSVPTDCPQRDERLGWTGDIAIFAPSANYLYDTVGFLAGWLEDLAAEQLEDGRNGIPGLVCPDVPLKDWPRIPQAIWHDVTVILPDCLYNFSNDKNILQRQFESMQAWLVHGIDRGADGLWNLYRWQFADWLDPTAPPQQPALSRTDSCLVADAYLVHVTAVFARVCSVLDKSSLSEKYTNDAAHLKSIFQSKYITPSGNLMSNTQTALALAIRFDLYPQYSQRATATEQLSKLVRSARFHIATGFAGTPEISHALTDICQPQLAYRMLLEKTLPSWIYPITMGATTVWERWDSMLPDGTINPGRMTSFNHYALGAVANWLHARVAGLSPAEPGWKTVRVRPVPGGDISWAEGAFEGPYGMVRCKWWLESGRSSAHEKIFKMDLTVPPNSKAIVTLPSQWKSSATDEREEPSKEVASGEHHFECTWLPEEWPPKVLLPPNIRYSPEMDEVAV